MSSRMPVAIVCASDRHCPNRVASTTTQGPSRIKLDLHTIQGPIKTRNLNLTIKNIRLADIAVNDVLTFCMLSSGNHMALLSRAKEKTPCSPLLPTGYCLQCNRIAAWRLASLRVFTSVIGTEEFNDYRQNEVLRILHTMTRFPRAVRSAQILIEGKTLRPNESAALVQSIAAVAEELIPLDLVSNDTRRSLEGARLVLGITLHSVRTPESRDVDNVDISDTILPYVAGHQQPSCEMLGQWSQSLILF